MTAYLPSRHTPQRTACGRPNSSRSAPSRSGRGRAITPQKAALTYARWGWPVMVGAAIPDSTNPSPDAGADAGLTEIDGVLEPTTDLDRVRQWWDRRPDAGIVAPAGEVFEVVTLPMRAGRTVLDSLTERGAWLGPVMSDDDTLSLLVHPNQSGSWVGMVSGSGDGFAHTGPGRLVVLPSGGIRPDDRVRWVVPPTDANTPRLPPFQELSPIVQSVRQASQRRRWLG